MFIQYREEVYLLIFCTESFYVLVYVSAHFKGQEFCQLIKAGWCHMQLAHFDLRVPQGTTAHNMILELLFPYHMWWSLFRCSVNCLAYT
jgi:hypothetical protein